MLKAERIEARTVLWAAGVQASPAKWLGVTPDRSGRVIAGPQLSVEGLPNVFVVGDAAHAEGRSGAALPAWLLWGVAHIYFLIGNPNCLARHPILQKLGAHKHQWSECLWVR
jgi:hypothetical protein